MSKEKSLVPELRFPEFSEVWIRTTLREIAKIYDGTHQTPTYAKSGIRFLSVENVPNYDHSIKYISIEDYEKLYKNKPTKNDILITRIGEIGRASIIEVDTKFAYYVSLALIKVNKEKIFPQYMFQYIASNYFQKELHKRTLHIAFPQKINLGDLGDCGLNFPNIFEQQKIATFLSLIDKKIELLEKKVKLLEKQKRGLLQKIFSQEIRFKRDDGTEFEEWETAKLGNICSIKTGKLDANAMTPNGEYKFFTCSRDEYSTDIYAFDGESLIIAGNGDVGHVKYYKGRFNAYQRTYVLQNFNAVAKYIQFYLNHFLPIHILRNTNHGAMPYIVLGTLRDFYVSIPNQEEQTKIADFLSKHDFLIDHTKSKLENIVSMKKGLLQKMFI